MEVRSYHLIFHSGNGRTTERIALYRSHAKRPPHSFRVADVVFPEQGPTEGQGQPPHTPSGGLRIADPLGVRFYCLLFHSGNGRTTERIASYRSAKNGHHSRVACLALAFGLLALPKVRARSHNPQRRFEDSRSFGSPFLPLNIPFRKRTNNRADSLKPERKKWPPHSRWPVSHLPLVCSPYRRSGRGPTPPAKV